MTADLFGGALPQSETTAEPTKTVTTRCAECGASFQAARIQGRPERFCSEPCRHRHKRDQIAAWQGQDAPTHCAGCERELPTRDTPGGRHRQFCNQTCRARLKRRERRAEPILPDFLNQPHGDPDAET